MIQYNQVKKELNKEKEINTKMKLTKRELKELKKVIDKYNYWIEHDMIMYEWENEDYDNTMNYEDINGNVIAVERDENDNIVYAWEN